MNAEEKFKKEIAILSVDDEIKDNYINFVKFLSKASKFGIKADYVGIINYAYAGRMNNLSIEVALFYMNDNEKRIIKRIKEDLARISKKNRSSCKVR